MSDIAALGKNQNRVLKETQDESNDRRQELVTENERKLKRLRDSYKQREDEIRESGDATINHLRKTTEEKVATSRHDSRVRLERENEIINQNYDNLKKRSSQQLRSLDKQNHARHEAYESEREAMAESQAEVMRREQDRTREFVQDQQKAKAKVAQESSAEMQSLQHRNTERLTQARQAADAQIDTVHSDYKRKVDDLQRSHKTNYDKAKTDADQRLATLRSETELKSENEMKTSHQALNEIQARYKQAAIEEQRSGEKQISKLDTDNRKRLEQKQRQAINVEDGLERQYQREIARVQTAGETDIRERKENFEKVEKKQEEAHLGQIQDNDERFNRQEREKLKAYETKARESGQTYQRNLEQQRKDFQKKFDRADQVHRDSFQNQEAQLLQELYKQKLSYETKIKDASSKKEDGFYSLRDLGAQIEETPSSYVLTARIPGYEKDTVDVRVKEDRVILSAKRAHEHAIDQSGVKTSTNTYQTFRQEFPLAIPVAEREIVKRLDDQGQLEVIMPKKGYSTRA
ncbi:MAG: Hsp20 family protein [Bdellovibrionaceae bacterium]|nr:Hsp20 family protein [Pseudobdellovibrionaceae bacterium]